MPSMFAAMSTMLSLTQTAFHLHSMPTLSIAMLNIQLVALCQLLTTLKLLTNAPQPLPLGKKLKNTELHEQNNDLRNVEEVLEECRH